MRKAREGVKVRFIYDDFGSNGLKKRWVREMEEAGVEIYPFYKIYFVFLASRINYRNHRKLIIIDGQVGFTGGINVSDKYINGNDPNKALLARYTCDDRRPRSAQPAIPFSGRLEFLFRSEPHAQ